MTVPDTAAVRVAADLPPGLVRRPDRWYPNYIFDLDGTVYLGDELLPRARQIIEAIRAAGGVVDHGMSLFYYGIFKEAEARYANGGVRLHHIATWRDVLAVARAEKLFDDTTLASVAAFFDAPLAWSAAQGGVAELPTA